VNVEFEWYGVTRDEKNVKSITRHRWMVADNEEERFARIKKMEIVQLVPFTTY
jgi:hypothetical protein